MTAPTGEVDVTDIPYEMGPRIGTRATLGLIVLQSDETIEQDFRRLFPEDDIAIYASRVPSGLEVSPDTLAEMAENLPASSDLFPKSISFDVVGYGCTSGTAVIGADQVASLVKSRCETPHVTNPLTSLIAQCRAKNVTRLALVSPYVESVSQTMRDRLSEAGIETPIFGSFGVAEEAKVARIAQASIEAAAINLAKGTDVDAVFLSCTNLRTLEAIPNIEAALGIPVFSSNQALAWHMSTLAMEHATA
jgi:maleate isomerase